MSIKFVKFLFLCASICGMIIISTFWGATSKIAIARGSLENYTSLNSLLRTNIDSPSGDSANESCANSVEMQNIRKVKLLCWVLCDPNNLHKVSNVKNTWMKHCDKKLFMSSSENKTYPTVGLNVSSGRNHIASKAKAAWKYIYSNHLDEFDYFMKADPDTYVIVRHLKAYLSHRNPDQLEFMGHLFKLPGPEHLKYFSGGSGEIMSRGALRTLVSKVWSVSESCMPDGQGEDYKIARCLSQGGVTLIDTRDSKGKETMLVFDYKTHLKGNYMDWYKVYDQHNSLSGRKCCSDYPISFHYIREESMQELDYYFQQMDLGNESQPVCLPAQYLKFFGS